MKRTKESSIPSLRRRCALLPIGLAVVAGCGKGAPPTNPVGVQEVPARVNPPAPPTPCERAASFRAGAQSAFAEGHLLRALRRANKAAALCPGEAPAAQELSRSIEVALQGREMFAQDAPGVAPSADTEADYRRAVGHILGRRLDEAGRAAMRVALAGGHLGVQALLVAARAAALQDRAVQANRMFARAAHSLSTSGREPRVDAPRDDLLSLPVTHPDYQPVEPSCVNTRDERASVLTPDGRFLAKGTARGVDVYAVDGRFLTDWLHLSPTEAEYVCLSAEARFRVLVSRARSGALGSAGPASAGHRRVTFDLKDHEVFVEPDGTTYLGRFRGFDSAPEWYWARPGDRAVRPVFQRDGAIVGIAPDGDVIGIVRETKPNDWRSELVRFNPTTGKIRMRATVPNYGRRTITRDGRALYSVDDRLLTVVDLESGVTKSTAWPQFGLLEGVLGNARVLLRHRADDSTWAFDVDHGTLEPAGAVVSTGDLTIKAGASCFVVRRPDGVLVFDLETAQSAFYSPGYPVEDVALSDDKRWLAVAGAKEVVAVDLKHQGRPSPVYRRSVEGHDVVFDTDSTVLIMRPPGAARSARERWSAHDVALGNDVPVPPPRSWPPRPSDPQCPDQGAPDDVVTAPGGSQVYLCDGVLWRKGPGPSAAATRLGAIDLSHGRFRLVGWNERADFLILKKILRSGGDHGRYELRLVRAVDQKLRTLRLSFARGASGGMALDDEGYYEFFGDVPPAFRAAAACGHDHPVEVCADRWEAPGMTAKFVLGDLSYHEP